MKEKTALTVVKASPQSCIRIGALGNQYVFMIIAAFWGHMIAICFQPAKSMGKDRFCLMPASFA